MDGYHGALPHLPERPHTHTYVPTNTYLNVGVPCDDKRARDQGVPASILFEDRREGQPGGPVRSDSPLQS